jgi:hypothetical protein
MLQPGVARIGGRPAQQGIALSQPVSCRVATRGPISRRRRLPLVTLEKGLGR